MPNAPSKRKDSSWLISGIFATLFFGFYGLFVKLSTFQQPLISNLIIYGTATLSGIILTLITKNKVVFSMEGFLSGISSDIGALIMLYLLISNQVLVVFSFVSFASALFFLIVLVCEKPELSDRQESIAVIGISVAVFGLFLASTSTAGGLTHLLKSSVIDPFFLLLASVIPIGLGLWTYLSYVAIRKRRTKIQSVFLNYSLGSLVIAVIAFPLFGVGFPSSVFTETRNLIPVIAGLLVMGGDILTLRSYQVTSDESRIDETIVAILANAEIVPLIFLSYFILGEFTIEGIAGALTVFVGLSILNSAKATH